MKVEIDFPGNFETNSAGPIHLGRLYLGNNVVRIFFDTTGQLKIAIMQSAIDDGSVIIMKPINENDIIGFETGHQKKV